MYPHMDYGPNVGYRVESQLGWNSGKRYNGLLTEMSVGPNYKRIRLTKKEKPGHDPFRSPN